MHLKGSTNITQISQWYHYFNILCWIITRLSSCFFLKFKRINNIIINKINNIKHHYWKLVHLCVIEINFLMFLNSYCSSLTIYCINVFSIIYSCFIYFSYIISEYSTLFIYIICINICGLSVSNYFGSFNKDV